jgi:Uncharacterized conserved protein
VDLHFQGEFVVDADIQRVWGLITNIDEVRKIIPDLREYESIDHSRARVVLGVGLGLIKGSFRMLLTVDPVESLRSIRIICEGDGLQSRALITIKLVLEPLSDFTMVRWDADVSIIGLIANVGTKLVHETSKRKVSEIVEGIKRALSKE